MKVAKMRFMRATAGYRKSNIDILEKLSVKLITERIKSYRRDRRNQCWENAGCTISEKNVNCTLNSDINAKEALSTFIVAANCGSLF